MVLPQQGGVDKLERLKKFCSRLRASRESGLFEFWLRFGSVAGHCGHAPSPKPRQNSKILASNGHRISLSALALALFVILTAVEQGWMQRGEVRIRN
jgi:hypothetical protein